MRINKTPLKVHDNKKKTARPTNQSKTKISKVQLFKKVWNKMPAAIQAKNDDGIREFKEKFNKIKIQQRPLKLRVNVKVQESVEEKKEKAKQAQKKTLNSFNEKVKIRAMSQATQKKKLIMEKQKQKAMEEEKKATRLKQIQNRKQQLLEKLKKIDAELLQAKRENSPIHEKSLFAESKGNQSFFKNQSALSRASPKNEDAYNVSRHTKAVEMLERINNEKIKRQEKIAKQLKRKQNLEIRKLTEIQKKKDHELEERGKKELIEIPIKNNPFNKEKDFRVHQTTNFEKHASVLPTTLQKTAKERKKSEESLSEDNFDQFQKNNRLETERQEMIAKLRSEKEDIENEKVTERDLSENYNEQKEENDGTQKKEKELQSQNKEEKSQKEVDIEREENFNENDELN